MPLPATGIQGQGLPCLEPGKAQTWLIHIDRLKYAKVEISRNHRPANRRACSDHDKHGQRRSSLIYSDLFCQCLPDALLIPGQNLRGTSTYGYIWYIMRCTPQKILGIGDIPFLFNLCSNIQKPTLSPVLLVVSCRIPLFWPKPMIVPT